MAENLTPTEQRQIETALKAWEVASSLIERFVAVLRGQIIEGIAPLLTWFEEHRAELEALGYLKGGGTDGDKHIDADGQGEGIRQDQQGAE